MGYVSSVYAEMTRKSSAAIQVTEVGLTKNDTFVDIIRMEEGLEVRGMMTLSQKLSDVDLGRRMRSLPKSSPQKNDPKAFKKPCSKIFVEPLTRLQLRSSNS